MPNLKIRLRTPRQLQITAAEFERLPLQLKKITDDLPRSSVWHLDRTIRQSAAFRYGSDTSLYACSSTIARGRFEKRFDAGRMDTHVRIIL